MKGRAEAKVRGQPGCGAPATGSGRRFLRQVGLLAAKDLKLYLLDRAALLFSLVFPFVFILLFSLVMGGAFSSSDEPYTVYVATEEPPPVCGSPAASPAGGLTGSLSRSIIDAMTESASENRGKAGGLAVVELDPERARDLLAAEKIDGYLLFPADFSARVAAGQPTTLTVRVNPEAGTTRAALLSIAGALTNEFEAYEVRAKAIAALAGAAGPGPDNSGARAGAGSGTEAGMGPAAGIEPGVGAGPVTKPGMATGWDQEPGVQFVFEDMGAVEPPKAVDLFLPGYLTMFVFFALSLNAAALVQERENYTLERLVVASATRLSIVVGKMAGAFARGLVQIVIFWAAGLLLFHVRMGRHPVTVVAVSVLLTLAASAVGVFLASVARTSRSASSAAVFTSLGCAALGGSMWPLFVMPAWLQGLARVTPHAWANSAFNKLLLFGAGPAAVAPEMLALALFALIFGALGVWRFRVE